VNCILKHVIKEKIEGNTEMTGRRGRRSKQTFDDLREKERYSKLKQKAPDRTLQRTSYGPAVGQTVKLTNNGN
jgi:hypothetical protein